MFHFELLQYGGTVVGHNDIAHIVDEHFIETDRTQGRLDEIGNRDGSSDIVDANVGASFAAAAEELKKVERGRKVFKSE
jgi:hypothetical protein